MQLDDRSIMKITKLQFQSWCWGTWSWRVKLLNGSAGFNAEIKKECRFGIVLAQHGPCTGIKPTSSFASWNKPWLSTNTQNWLGILIDEIYPSLHLYPNPRWNPNTIKRPHAHTIPYQSLAKIAMRVERMGLFIRKAKDDVVCNVYIRSSLIYLGYRMISQDSEDHNS